MNRKEHKLDLKVAVDPVTARKETWKQSVRQMTPCFAQPVQHGWC